MKLYHSSKPFIALLIALYFNIVFSNAQEILSLREAIESVLSKNLSIEIVKSEAQIAAQNNTLANAGFLPTIDLNASQSKSINSAVQRFNNGAEQRRNNATNISTQAGAILTWTLFDGLNMFVKLKNLGLQHELAELKLREQAQKVVYDINVCYHQAIYHKLLIGLLNENLKLFDQYMFLVKEKINVGLAPKIDLLQLQSSRNETRTLVIEQQLSYQNAKTKINELMSVNIDKDFEVSDSIILLPTIQKESIDLSNNIGLTSLKKKVEISTANIKQAQSAYFPNINFVSGYNYVKNQNQVGFLLFNQSRGANFGLIANWTVFNARATARAVQEAKISQTIAKAALQRDNIALQAKLSQMYKIYKTQKELLEIETENLEIARQLAELTLEKYTIGSVALLQSIESQRAFQLAEQRYTQVLLNVKLAELELLFIDGKIIQDKN